MQICPNADCKADNMDTALYCSQCGTKLRQLLGRGALLQNRYRIDDLLGCGGFGVVYKATDMSSGGVVAVKQNLEPAAQKAFLTEASLLALLKHPNLPQVISYFEERGRQYLVMEFIEGKDLDEVVLAKGRLSWQEALKLLEPVFNAVAYLHRQTIPIIHRDIKPPNIKVSPDGRTVLVDFGIAKVGGASIATITGAKGYTPGFAPLEQFGTGRTDERSDIYALGATLYFCLTGQVPPPAPDLAAGTAQLVPLHQINNSVSTQVTAAIEKAMALAQDQRFQSVDQFWQALMAKPLPSPAPSSQPTPPKRQTYRLARWLGLALMALLFIGFQRWKTIPQAPPGMVQPKLPPTNIGQRPSQQVTPQKQPIAPSPTLKGKSKRQLTSPPHRTALATPQSSPSTPQRHLQPPKSPQQKVEQLKQEAREAVKEHRFSDAKQKLEQAITLEPNDDTLHFALALVGMQIEDLELAQKHFKQAVALAPHKADYWAALGWLHLQKDETQQSKKCFEKALSLDSQNARAKEGMKLLE